MQREHGNGDATARVLAHSPGRHPILVAELNPGGLRVLYHETGYDVEKTKPVTHEWLRENAIGRHSFIPLEPPREMPASALSGFVEQELLGTG
jgi:hypothetical protein